MNDFLQANSKNTGNPKSSASSTNLQAQSSSQGLENRLEDVMPTWEIYENVKEKILKRDGVIKHSTGLTELDDMLFGLHKPELVVIGARTSMGKSALALQIAKELADNNEKVAFFSLEMSKEQLVERLITNICHIHNIRLRKGLANEELLSKESVFKNWSEEAKLLIDDKYGYSFAGILKVIKALEPDWVFVDYVQMISTKGFKDKLAALEDFVKEIHRLGIVNNFGTILVSQINRQGVEEASMQHLKHGGILEEHADVVILCKWNSLTTGHYKISVQKNRNGRTGELLVNFLPEYNRFEDFKGNALEELERKDLE